MVRFGGGVSQYLTTVQGMPKKIESTLQKMINKFVWDGKWPSINQQILGTPIHDGGIQLLDIKSRNEAIELMWLKKYLQFGAERPLWASLADFLIEEDIPRSSSINKELTINVFLQEWGPYLSQKSKLPTDIKRMLHVAKNTMSG